MRTTSRRRPVLRSVLLTTLVAAGLAGCGAEGNTEEQTVRREPVAFAGTTPFTPPAGNDQAGVTPPPDAGGTFPGDTVGLFGGTENETTCDKAQLVAFLQQDRPKAEAWAAVVGIRVEEIPAFVAGLTPAVLRSDTRVINHGFENGKAVEIPAVFQAGTAVLVDIHGAPVAKCFCGNPLKTPPATTSVTFIGPEWPNFSSTQVTVIAPVTQTVQQFVFVDVQTGRSFQRPAGTAGQQDAPAPTPAPTRFPTPATPPVTATGTATTGSVPPPGIAVPSATPPAGTTAPTGPTPTGTTPTTGTTSPSGPTTSPTSPTASPSPTATASPSASPTASPSVSPPVVPPGSPSPSVSPTSPSPSPSSPSAVRASWVVGDCFVQAGRAHGEVLVRTESPDPQRFTVRVELGDQTNPIAVETVQVTAPPGEIGRAEVEAPTNTPDGRVQCQILSIVDEHGNTPIAGPPLPPPSDSVPMPGQPSPAPPVGPPTGMSPAPASPAPEPS